MSSYKYKVKNISLVSGDVIILDLIPKKDGEVFSYKPGQYAMLSPYDKNGYPMSARPFSIASSPTQKDSLQFGIKITGNFTKRLSKLSIGDKIIVSAPYGEFIYDEKKAPDAVFIAGGIGITPFISAIRYAQSKQIPQHITLLYSNRKIVVTTFKNELENISQNNTNIKTIFSITDETIPVGEKNLENGRINKDMLLKYTDADKNKIFSICGPSGFITAMKNNLLSLGIPEQNIKYELFSAGNAAGYSKKSSATFFIYTGTFIMFLILLFSVNNAESKKISAGDTTTKKYSSNNISFINEIAVNRKNKLEETQKTTLLNTKNAELKRQAKLQENIFKQETAQRQTKSSISETQQIVTQPSNKYIAPIRRIIRPRTTIS